MTAVDVTTATFFPRFLPEQNGREFRRAAFASLADRYRSHVIFRHALPFCVTEDAYFGLSVGSDCVLAAVLPCHTLALTNPFFP